MTTVALKDLRAGLKIVAPAVEHWAKVPVLQCVELRQESDGLRLRATNLDIEITHVITNDSVPMLPVLIPFRRLSGVLKGMWDDEIDIDFAEGGSISIRGVQSKSESLIRPFNDTLPDLTVSGERTFEGSFASGQLQTLLQQVSGAISTEATRYYLNGVCFQPDLDDAERLRLTATDGYCLESRASKINMVGTAKGEIVPHAVIKVLADLPEDAEPVLSFFSTALECRAGSTRIVAKLIDGTFPDWRRVVPSESTSWFETRTAEIVRAVQFVKGAMSKKTARCLGLIPTVLDDAPTLVLRAKLWPGENAEAGDDEIATFTSLARVEGTVFALGVNPFLLSRALARVVGGTVRFVLQHDGGPIRFIGADETAISVVMPMRGEHELLQWPRQTSAKGKKARAA